MTAFDTDTVSAPAAAARKSQWKGVPQHDLRPARPAGAPAATVAPPPPTFSTVPAPAEAWKESPTRRSEHPAGPAFLEPATARPTDGFVAAEASAGAPAAPFTSAYVLTRESLAALLSPAELAELTAPFPATFPDTSPTMEAVLTPETLRALEHDARGHLNAIILCTHCMAQADTSPADRATWKAHIDTARLQLEALYAKGLCRNFLSRAGR